MNNDVYDIFKMQHDDMEKLNAQEQALIDKSKSVNEDAKASMANSDDKFEQNLAWVRSLGINPDKELAEARDKGNLEATRMIEEVENANESFSKFEISYDDLVKLAHERGYVNTQIQDLLTEDEIRVADERLKSIEEEFKAKTKLKKLDIAFLVTAIALQVVRQYVITPFSDKDINAKDGSKIMEDKYGKDGKLKGKYYYATEETIIGQKKVPYDIITGSKKYGIGGDGKGLDGNSHRFRSLGHDPILGYLFGTANIVTNTATWWNGTSHHIMYKPNNAGVMVPTLAANADTAKMFEYVVNRFNGKDGKRILVEAIVKEHLHLKSDQTTDGLPIPFLQAISPDFAQTLAEFGLDAIALRDIAKQAAGAEFINFVISTIHGLLCAESGEMNTKLYKVRTKKIILISNVIASTSNLIAVGVAAGIGATGENPEMVKKSLKYLDVGGILVTITHLFTDVKFILKVKEEFINSKLDAQIIEEIENLDRLLEE
ncbi:hypothetical protein BLA28_21550 [Eisenbergiella tayi]|uniref:hypothetical protein n=1 Tax=Eisenbergiella tayi TaxID=1432052 RepID=UPI0008FD5B41|nr:hypothetical protein [Eisenbergiella tayi]OIZ62952.1 hypothetical protein BLA28_21550 [Eisenbergiella tayi]